HVINWPLVDSPFDEQAGASTPRGSTAIKITGSDFERVMDGDKCQRRAIRQAFAIRWVEPRIARADRGLHSATVRLPHDAAAHRLRGRDRLGWSAGVRLQ